MDPCPKCTAPMVEGERPDGVTVWRCASCGSEVIDGATAEWKGGIYQASSVQLIQDGNQVCALVGKNLVEGVSGYGATVPEALRDLADQMIRLGIWIDVMEN
jgi:hypothetical protein